MSSCYPILVQCHNFVFDVITDIHVHHILYLVWCTCVGIVSHVHLLYSVYKEPVKFSLKHSTTKNTCKQN